MRKLLTVLIVLLLWLGISAFVDPFDNQYGPVRRIEYRHYEVETRFGELVLELASYRVTLYDREGNDIETTHYNAGGSVTERYERVYDAQNRVVEITKFNWLGNVETITSVTHDGSLQRTRSYDARGRMTSASDHEMNADGKLIRIVLYDVETGAATSTAEIVYTEDGEPRVAEMRDEDGDLTMRTEHQYNVGDKDVISRTVMYVLGVELLTIESASVLSEIDEYGNWTEKRRYKYEEKFGESGWVLDAVYRRTLEYYN